MVQGHFIVAVFKLFSFAGEVWQFFWWLYGCFSVTIFRETNQIYLKGSELKITAIEISYYCNTRDESFQWWLGRRHLSDNGISAFPEQELLLCSNQRLLVVTRNSYHLTAMPVNNFQKNLSKFTWREPSNTSPKINVILTVLFH